MSFTISTFWKFHFSVLSPFLSLSLPLLFSFFSSFFLSHLSSNWCLRKNSFHAIEFLRRRKEKRLKKNAIGFHFRNGNHWWVSGQIVIKDDPQIISCIIQHIFETTTSSSLTKYAFIYIVYTSMPLYISYILVYLFRIITFPPTFLFLYLFQSKNQEKEWMALFLFFLSSFSSSSQLILFFFFFLFSFFGIWTILSWFWYKEW